MRILLALLLLPFPAQAGLRVAKMFGDHMVLQREIPVPVWGWAEPGEKVTVRMADQSAEAVADKDGKWTARIGPFKAGGPHTLTISGKATIDLRDVLVGDVWVCSGQSNMEWTVSGAMNAQREIGDARNPKIRHFAVPKSVQAAPLADLAGGAWQECRPETVGTWTAVGYFFARHLQEKLGVPIGLVHTSWGGTVCEAWTSGAALKTMADFRAKVEDIEASIDRLPQLQREYVEKLVVWEKAFADLDEGAKKKWAEAIVDVSSWKTMTLPSAWENAGLPNLDGVVWFRKEVAIPATWTGRELTLSLGPIDDADETYFNGTRIGATSGWQAPRAYKVPGTLVKPGLNAIAVRVSDTGGGGGIYGKAEQMKLEGPGPAIPLAGAWPYAVGLDLAKAPPKPTLPFANDPNGPTALYNGMIAPVIPYAIKGAIWYQGESNVGRARQYQTLFPTMIKDWRSRWGVGEFPFLFVQLANFLPAKAEPGESAWAELREAQELTLGTPNTGQAVIIDIGDAADIHPRNKQDVGKRLAIWALGTTYGEKAEYSGPLYASMAVEEGRVRVTFKHAGGGLVAKGGEALKTFAIAGADRKWVWAEAKIDGDSVVVWSGKVAKPVAVRYAWADNPDGCNLYNKEGLPASPFRTDR
ncbi:MAG TPA: sialate O-acetylesterase [Planctomycetota bacterium]|nr:sialate O-acetylesterase [Planctomycetota bacterium]